ncbi:TOMM system kinase/cyclase fusion protein [Sorangium sp. So ce854]|uniref:TOMM system kinase/cyclase fusion protein n=1 Tax=Sorangium sp. So ce854 TaxID=3133322 RepID=UPI003F5EF156
MNAEVAAAENVFQGRYEILSLLRKEDLAALYEGRQLATGQRVAIKVLRPGRDGGSPDAARRRGARFRREMRFCAQLHHPHIVRLIDSGQTDAGQLYSVFELVPGQSLAELLEAEGALEPHEARHLMLQVLDALSCAHGRGVVHGGLRPGAITIVLTGARRNALVLDFGIGAAIAGARGDADETPAESAPVYAAPEQRRGFPPTARSDLYAWGLVFLECLTGRPAVIGAAAPAGPHRPGRPPPVRIPPALLGHPLGALLRRTILEDLGARSVTAESLLRELEACSTAELRREDLIEPAAAPAPVRPGGAAEAAEDRSAIEPTARASWAAAQRGIGPSVAGAAREDAAWPETLVRPAARGAEPTGGAEPGAGGAEPGAGGAEPAADGAVPASRPREAERRPLTAVCCVVTAAGPGMAAMEVEEIDELFGEVQELCAEVARRHRGRFAGALGDQVLLHFGFPVAQEDDARRAARAALEIAARIRGRSARLSAERGIAIDVRAGIHTGIVVALEGQQHIQHLGVTLQTAARLGALAAPGAVQASGDTHQLLRGAFELEATELRVSLGSARAAPVYRVREELPREAPERPGPGDEAAPLFGREQELALLIQRWRQIRRSAGQSVLVTGGPGIGKSRLALELARRLRLGPGDWLECRCMNDRRHSPLHPVVDLLERLLEPDAGDTSRSRLERLEALLSAYPFDLSDAVPVLAALLSIPLGDRYAPPQDPPQRQKERTFATLLSLLFERAERRPVLIVVEDLHWADALTIEWLGALVAEISSARVLALMTARPEFVPSWPTSGMLQIQLGRLDRAHVQAMTAAIAGGRALPGEVLEQIARRADGVPLFIEELTRMVLESGALREEGDRHVLAGPLSEVAIPTTLRGLLMARLDRLGRAKETAQAAAVLGREFSGEVLGAVSALGPEAVEEDLERLVAADLVHRRHRARSAVYMFRHALLRDAAYESLPRRTRQQAHARSARAIEERFPEIAEARPELLSWHHASAGQMRQAIAYAERAAERALQRPAGRVDETEAVTHLHNALGWLSALPEGRDRAMTELRLNNLLILALLDRRGYMNPELVAAVRRCEELNDSLGESPLTTPTLGAMFVYHHVRSPRREARAVADRLVASAERAGDTGQLVWSLPLLGQCLWIEGKLPEARASLERVLALYSPEAHGGQVFVYGLDARVYAEITLSVVLCLMGYTREALAHGEAAAAWAHRLQHVTSIGMAQLYRLMVYHACRMRANLATESRELTELVDRERLWFRDYCWTLRCSVDGDLDRLMEHVATLRDAGLLLGMTYYPSLEAELMAERAQHAAAIERLDDCLRTAERMGEEYYVPELYRLKAASVLACDPGASGGEACLQQAIVRARAQGARLPELRATLALCRTLLGQRRDDEALVLLSELDHWPAEYAALPELAEARGLLRELSDERRCA